MENSEIEEVDIFADGKTVQPPQPLEYSVGEICKCFYNSVTKHGYECAAVQTTSKCQGYCRVVEKNEKEHREYTVEVFNPVGDRIKRLPGCCLRKTKLIPYTKEEAIRRIGSIVCSKDKTEYMQIVSVSIDGKNVRINDLTAKELLEDFVDAETGAPCGRIVMLKADEAFGGEYGAQFTKNAKKWDDEYIVQ